MPPVLRPHGTAVRQTREVLPDLLPDPWDPDAFADAFSGWAADRGLRLYPAQEESLLELLLDRHLVLSTPTGSGKSLVAVAAHAMALAQGRRSYYTAPIKALVSEKFFQLAEVFGAERVGMITGDSSVNPDAPIICCTAEILANLALRRGEDAEVGQVVMDEFHFYADRDRGWAWQVPLLRLPRTQFVLMSATLGDVSAIAEDLERRTGVEVARVTGVERPVPLHHRWVETPVQETVEQLLGDGLSPVYIVHFSQAAAVERAQALASVRVATREQRDAIAEAVGGFRFAAGFGQSLGRLVRAGIGVHHAGMLPRYRRLVEQLAQRGLLRVICGTDTLGVGINVPIRTVLLTGLAKYDGSRMRRLSAREFHQIAGRAGRAGYDTAGEVVVEAPEHEIENLKALAKAGDDPKRRRKVVRKRAPEGSIVWGEEHLAKLMAAEPEPLRSSMQLSAAMLMNVIGRGADGGRGVFEDVRGLVLDNHEPPARQRALARRALQIYRTLRIAGVVEQEGGGFDGSARIRLTLELQPDFALNQPLSPFALAVIDLLEVDAPGYALDVLSVVEATLDDPRPVLSQQEFRARGEAVAAMKAEGIEYEERMALLEEVTWPRPLAQLLGEAYEVYAASQPWVRDSEIRPKSVVRDMWERSMSFTEYVGFYQLDRSEGLVLRYLSDAVRALRQTVPSSARTEEVEDLIAWLGELVRQVDSSLLDEWADLVSPASEPERAVVPPPPASIVQNERAFGVLVRNELWRRVRLAALDRETELRELDPEVDWGAALDAYYAEHDEIGTDADARSATRVQIRRERSRWLVRQVLADPAGHGDWGISAEVDLDRSAESGEVVLSVRSMDRL
ncbi:DEAD/DEAH box helicase [Homoserinibacter sp. YIM 151385]|uniref:DEAD/DEAH box helicase n=1 Tax=Homoserinibacter sp. YIM 151385 TaxID=2985506 RepID=UPI0022F0868C|nr:DEAD/DEAH box helicase [Homoserinibacter sp. YIM 151385]WBU38381.1 DUF3516 domain-containing protein [Homoserinibacter sp. YIM 151385]